jgi:hypothetical protein
MAKQVANSLLEVLQTSQMRAILDRRSDLTETIEKVVGAWSYDLYSRKPGPAYRDAGVFRGTDLDLACFLYALVDRSAVIVIPEYTRLRPKTLKEGELVTSSKQRHGKILGLVSNQSTFVFSVKILDANVISTDEVGGYRNFALTDFDGNWYEGWHEISFLPSESENKFLTENKLWNLDGCSVSFKNFVAPQRWLSFYGQSYFISKALLQRLKEESSYLRAHIKAMRQDGIQFPQEAASPRAPRATTRGESRPIEVSAFEVEVDLPEPVGQYAQVAYSQESLAALSERLSMYRNVLTRLQFMTRATELAFYRHGDATLPGWIKNAQWESHKVAKTTWARLILFQPRVGDLGVSIRTRAFKKTERISESAAL